MEQVSWRASWRFFRHLGICRQIFLYKTPKWRPTFNYTHLLAIQAHQLFHSPVWASKNIHLVRKGSHLNTLSLSASAARRYNQTQGREPASHVTASSVVIKGSLLTSMASSPIVHSTVVPVPLPQKEVHSSKSVWSFLRNRQSFTLGYYCKSWYYMIFIFSNRILYDPHIFLKI